MEPVGKPRTVRDLSTVSMVPVITPADLDSQHESARVLVRVQV